MLLRRQGLFCVTQRAIRILLYIWSFPEYHLGSFRRAADMIYRPNISPYITSVAFLTTSLITYV